MIKEEIKDMLENTIQSCCDADFRWEFKYLFKIFTVEACEKWRQEINEIEEDRKSTF